MQDGASEIIGSYVKWHYSHALKELLNILRNVNRFLFHFFSIKLLFKTWVSPWRRLHEDYKGSFSLGAFFSSFIVNSLMRLVGFVFRTVILLVGSICLLVTLFLSACLFVLWLFFPLFLVALFASAVILIISAV